MWATKIIKVLRKKKNRLPTYPTYSFLTPPRLNALKTA
jgi:hypothetical protein